MKRFFFKKTIFGYILMIRPSIIFTEPTRKAKEHDMREFYAQNDELITKIRELEIKLKTIEQEHPEIFI